MHIGFLYDQAVELSPRAARIAAELLVQDPAIPPALRRSLSMALVPWKEAAETVASLSPGDRDVKAARHFVHACQIVCAVNREHAKHTEH